MGIMEALGLKKDEYHHKINAEVSDWDAQIERAKAERKADAADREWEKEEDYREYRAKRKDVDQRLAELRNASEDKWEDMKTGVEKAWLDAKNAFNKLGNRIKH